MIKKKKRTRITRNSWLTRSTCFTAVSMRSPIPPRASVLSQTHLPLPYPSSQLWCPASGMRGTSTTTGLQPVLLHLTTPNCKQSQMVSVIVGLEDVCQVHVFFDSAQQWMCLFTQDNTCPCPFAKCWCLDSDTTQITVSISTTS
jgi:hypothetical protein